MAFNKKKRKSFTDEPDTEESKGQPWHLTRKSEQSQNEIKVGDLANSFLIAYIVLAISTNRPQILAVFLLCECLFLFDINGLQEYQFYIIEFIAWSYIFTSLELKKNKLPCVIICLLSLSCIIDAYYFGVDTHGEVETWIYSNIQYIALCAHIIFISSFINLARIIDDTRRIVDSIVNYAVNSDCRVVIDYNKSILQKALTKK